jgi:hypothetical protein
MLDWVRSDTYFRVPNKRVPREIAEGLTQLEAHLLIWFAKYESWIPDHPERALVFLGDESGHGPGFPRELQDDVEIYLKT